MSCNHTRSALSGHLICIHNEAFADGLAEGKEVEREHLVKLIKNTFACYPDCDHYDCAVGWKSVLLNAIEGSLMSGVSRDYYAGHQRGLAEGEERAVERIIKLLEEMPTKAIKTEHGTQILSLELKDIIALIKGENK